MDARWCGDTSEERARRLTVERAGDLVPARPRLYAIPHAGGSAQLFRAWRPVVPAGVEIVPLELPGRWSRRNDAHPATLAELVQELAGTIANDAAAPVVLLGASFGATLAYEVARVLPAFGRTAGALIVLSAAPPRQGGAPTRWHRLPDHELLAAIEGRFGPFPDAVREADALRRMFLEVLREDLRLLETHRSELEPPLDCPIHVVVAAEDPTVRRSTAAGWSACTTGPATVRSTAGDHFFFRSEPARATVIRDVIATVIDGLRSDDPAAGRRTGLPLSLTPIVRSAASAGSFHRTPPTDRCTLP